MCTKGSQWARTGVKLVLRCVNGTWTAFDSAVSADRSTLQCRQPVFRCHATDITQPGWHEWETNYAASPNDAGLEVDWQGKRCAQTRVPCCNDASCLETTQVVDTQHQLISESPLKGHRDRSGCNEGAIRVPKNMHRAKQCMRTIWIR